MHHHLVGRIGLVFGVGGALPEVETVVPGEAVLQSARSMGHAIDGGRKAFVARQHHYRPPIPTPGTAISCFQPLGVLFR